MLLLVEDEPELRAELVELLELHGIHLVAADCVATALAAIKQTTTLSAVLSDMRLPDGSGMDIIKAARSGEATNGQRVRLALMTGQTDLTDRLRRQIDRLAVPLLFKPVHIGTLVSVFGEDPASC